MDMKRRPTINDVAIKASLSISTVSLVLNDKRNVSDETRLKVRQVMKELGYHPHHSARGLASKLTGNIGFILSADYFSQEEPFYTRIFLGTEIEARSHNYYILLTTVDTQAKSKNGIPRFLLERNVDGVIIAGKIGERLVERIDQLGVPLLLVDYALKRKTISSICIDNYQGARNASLHLIGGGHKKSGFIGGDIEHPSVAERFLAYKETLAEHNITVDPKIIVTDEEYAGVRNGFNAMARIFNQGGAPSAVFAANDAMAIGCMQYLKSVNKKIPRDCAVVGFDDIEMSSHTEPRLTTIRVFKEETGKIAVQRMVEMIKSKTKAVISVRVPVELVVRESCGIKPADINERHHQPLTLSHAV